MPLSIKYQLAYFPCISYFPLLSGCPDDVTEAVYEGPCWIFFFQYSRIKKGLCVANIATIRNLISGSALNETVDIFFVF